MKRISTILMIIVAMGFAASSCKKTPKSVTEIIGRAWVPQTVKEGTTLVYTKGGATNTRPGYSGWRLDLSSPTSATLKEFDGNSFSGQWEVREGTTNTLILKNLTPQPTGTNGTMEFTINSSSETQFDITRTTSSQKTGGTVNNYALVTP